MAFDSPRNRRDPGPRLPAWLIVAGVAVLAVFFLNGTKIPFGDRVVVVSSGYVIGIPQLVIVGLVGFWLGKMKSAGDLAPDDGAPTLTGRLRAVTKAGKDRKLTGVCGGLGEHTPLPAWIWRVLFILFAFASGFGLFVYIVLAFAMPEAPKEERKSFIRKPDEPGGL